MNKISHDSETAAEGQQVITAVAFISRVNNGIVEVFLPKRALTKKFLPGVYEMPGGHIDYGEDIVDGLKREIAEELSMRVKIGDPFACFTYLNAIKGSHSIEVVYFGSFIDSEDKIKINPEDHSEYGWFSKEYLIQNKQSMRASSEVVSVKGQIEDKDQEFNAVIKGFELIETRNLDIAR